MVELVTFKQHVRVSGSDEDAILQIYLDTAISKTRSRMGYAEDNTFTTRAFTMAVLLQAAWYYANRGDQAKSDMDPPGYKSLVALERPGASYV